MKANLVSIKKAAKLAALLLAGLAVALLASQSGGAKAQAGTFADPAFQTAWERTDLPVAQGKVNRSWVWGPAPGQSFQEPFAESPGGRHLVQYFDKARMEINDPSADKTSPFYVTNGLLVVEMISGRIQIGAGAYLPAAPNETQIAGDPGSDAPSYAALANSASVGQPGDQHRAAPLAPGTDMHIAFMNQHGVAGFPTNGPAGPLIPKAAAYSPETGHNIPDVFWSYLNAQGPVYENGGYTHGTVVNWVSAFGYPITEPYWTQIKVSGATHLVLFQAFQRRILTYSPDNPQGWQVEMGNVGSQYFAWRYSGPAISCIRVPLRGFGRVWANNASVQAGLGCPEAYPPYDKEIPVDTAWQPFQYGAMLWISQTTYVQQKIIFTFFDDGTFQRFTDTWSESEPVSAGLTPPPGLYEPQRGFGKVWREGTGANVRERLGWATAPEKGAKGSYERFTTGEMYWTGAANKIYVLFGTIKDSGFAPGNRYSVYDDTFTP